MATKRTYAVEGMGMGPRGVGVVVFLECGHSRFLGSANLKIRDRYPCQYCTRTRTKKRLKK